MAELAKLEVHDSTDLNCRCYLGLVGERYQERGCESCGRNLYCEEVCVFLDFTLRGLEPADVLCLQCAASPDQGDGDEDAVHLAFIEPVTGAYSTRCPQCRQIVAEWEPHGHEQRAEPAAEDVARGYGWRPQP